MAQKKGRALLIKRGSGSGPVVYTSVCGFKARSITINNNPVDVSVPDCETPEDKVPSAVAAGIQAIQFSGSGLFDNDTVAKAVAQDVIDQVFTTPYQVVVPGLGTFEGVFAVESLSYSGSEQGNLEFEATWRSNGAIAFTPEA